MPALNLTGFQGEIHILEDTLLPETVGVSSLNQRPGRGDLRAWMQPLGMTTVPAGRASIYLMNGGYWFSWTTVVHAVKGFDANDTTERFYYTGSGTPKWTDNVMGLGGGPPYPQASRELAVPPPDTTLTLTITTAGAGSVGTAFYCMTFVNDIGWESAPGPASSISAPAGSTITVSGIDTAPPAGNYGIDKMRLYKSVTGNDGSAAFFFHSEHALGTTSVVDSGQTLGEALATGANGIGASWTPPPTDGFGLVSMWNGMLAMASGKSVYVCEPFTPYAYPLKYRLDVADNIVGLAVFGQTMVVLTDGDVYVTTGSDPASLECIGQQVYQKCVSARSIVAFRDGVVFASPAGLWYFGDRGSYCLTAGVYDDKQWAALTPGQMKCSRHLNLRLVFCFYNNGTSKGFCIDIDQPSSVYALDAGYDAVHRAKDGFLYLLDGTAVRRWDTSSTPMTATFKSKAFQMPSHILLSALEIVGKSYAAHVKLWADGVLVLDRDMTGDDSVRPQERRAETLQIEVSLTAGSIQAVRAGQSQSDLRA